MPARIILENGQYSGVLNGALISGIWTAEQLAEIAAEDIVQGRLFRNPILFISGKGERTDAADYAYRVRMKVWASLRSPNHPCLHPDQPIDPRTAPADDF